MRAQDPEQRSANWRGSKTVGWSSPVASAMDVAMPQWRVVREQLNRLPVRHDEWDY